MKLYADSVQSQAQPAVLRNLIKNAVFEQTSQKMNKNLVAPAQAVKPPLMKKLDEVVGARISNFSQDTIPTIGERDYDVSKEEALELLNNQLYSLEDSTESGGLSIFQENEFKSGNGLSFEYDLSYFRDGYERRKS